MSLDQFESNIVPTLLKENQPPSQGWFTTVIAIHEILSNQLHKRDYGSVKNYLQKRWNSSCTVQCLYRLGNAGKVVKCLWDAGFRLDNLPSNTRLCLSVQQIVSSYNISYGDAWHTILETFGSRDNVYTTDVKRLFEESQPEPEPEPAPTPMALTINTSTATRAPGMQEPTPVSPNPASHPPARRHSVRLASQLQQQQQQEEEEEEEEEEEIVPSGPHRTRFSKQSQLPSRKWLPEIE